MWITSRIRHAAQDGLHCRAGSVVVRVLAGDRRALRARVTANADCTYRLRSRAFSLPSGLTRVVVRTRFLGSATLGSRSAPVARVVPRVLR